MKLLIPLEYIYFSQLQAASPGCRILHSYAKEWFKAAHTSLEGHTVHYLGTVEYVSTHFRKWEQNLTYVYIYINMKKDAQEVQITNHRGRNRKGFFGLFF